MTKTKIIRYLTALVSLALVCCDTTLRNSANSVAQDSLYYSIYPASGRIQAVGNIRNGRKEGVWKYYYDQDSLKLKYYMNFEDDSLDGTTHLVYENRGRIQKYISFYYKKGKCYFGIYHSSNCCVDMNSVYTKLNEIRDMLHYDEDEYTDIFDDEWNHKELGPQGQLIQLFSPPSVLNMSGYEYVYNIDSFGGYPIGTEYYDSLQIELEQISNDKIKYYGKGSQTN